MRYLFVSGTVLMLIACSSPRRRGPADAADQPIDAKVVNDVVPKPPDVVVPANDTVPVAVGCSVTPVSPAAQASTSGVVTVTGHVVVEPGGAIDRVRALYWSGSCATAPAPADLKELPVLSATEVVDGAFAWLPQALDLGAPPAVYEEPFDVCVLLLVELFPSGPGAEATQCSASVQPRVDRQCPLVVRSLPVSTSEVIPETYLGPLPIGVEVFDHSNVASLRLIDMSGATVHEFPLPAGGIQHDVLSATIDSCARPTGPWPLRFEATDMVGNSCVGSTISDTLQPACTSALPGCQETSFAPQIVHCPSYLGSIPIDCKLEHVTTIVSADWDQDGDMDVLGGTASGVQLFETDSGALGDPIGLPDIKFDVDYLAAVHLNPATDQNLDLIVVGTGDQGAMEARAYVRVGSSHPSKGLACEGEDGSLLPPGLCAPDRFALIDRLLLSPTAVVIAPFARDGDVSPFGDTRDDIVYGTESDDAAVGVVVGNSEKVLWTGPVGPVEVDSCEYRPAGDSRTPLSSLNPGSCFRPPRTVAGIGHVVSIAVAPLVDDADDALDIVVGRDGPTRAVSVFRHDGAGGLTLGFTWGEALLPAPVAQIVPAELDGDTAHPDLILVLTEGGQAWEVFGTGGTDFRTTLDGDITTTLVRLLCIEGAPSFVARGDLGGPDIVGAPWPDLTVANLATGALWGLIATAVDPATTQAGPHGTTFRLGGVTGIGVNPTRVLLSRIDDNQSLDAVVLSSNGCIVVAPGVGTADPTDPGFGQAGEFVGARQLMTPVVLDGGDGPAGDPYDACVTFPGGAGVPCDHDSSEPDYSEGTGLDRLTPEYFMVADVTGDAHFLQPLTVQLTPGTSDYDYHDFDGDTCADIVGLSRPAKAAFVLRSSFAGCNASEVSP